MNYRRILAALLVAFTLFMGATVLAAGSAADPLVSQSYLKTIFTTPLETYVQTALGGVSAAFEAKTQGVRAAAETYAREKVAAFYGAELSAAVENRVRSLLAQQAAGQLTAGMTLAEVPKDHVITGPAGACVLFLTGTGRTEGPEGAEILNVTAGSTRVPGRDIKAGILYMILADDGSGIGPVRHPGGKGVHAVAAKAHNFRIRAAVQKFLNEQCTLLIATLLAGYHVYLHTITLPRARKIARKDF